jgi:hypothetical protein
MGVLGSDGARACIKSIELPSLSSMGADSIYSGDGPGTMGFVTWVLAPPPHGYFCPDLSLPGYRLLAGIAMMSGGWCVYAEVGVVWWVWSLRLFSSLQRLIDVC